MLPLLMENFLGKHCILFMFTSTHEPPWCALENMRKQQYLVERDIHKYMAEYEVLTSHIS